MKESLWGYWILLLGIFIIVIMMLVSNVTTTNTQDYYLIKEVEEAAMVDAIDYGYYRESGELRINREKFVENFLRRFSEHVSLSTYQIDFYGIYETPPKVSVKVTTKSNTYRINSDSTTFDIVNKVDAILELDGKASAEVKPKTNNKTPENPSNPVTPSTNEPPIKPNNQEETPPSTIEKEEEKPTTTDNECSKEITGTSLKGFKGTSMVKNSMAYIYQTLDDLKSNKPMNTLVPGKIFTILGDKDDKYWAIEYNGKCGWVKNDYMAINLKDYIKEMEYNITNLSGSIYKSSGINLPNTTGKQLYTNEYASFVPATYSFAKLLKKAATTAKENGDTLVVYDAYRPKSVSTYASNALSNLMNTNQTVKNNILYSYGASGARYSWGVSWFLAQSLSAHNTACAVDITLKNSQMPTAMHELSAKAVKYYQAIKVRNQPLSYHEKMYSKDMTNDAKKLDKYMTNAGLDDLASEWWHYQSDTCHSRIKSATGGIGADFWSNV